MAFLDSIETIRGKATEAAQQAARKTKKLAEIAKANLSIYSEEDKIKKAQLELGKLYYRDYVMDEEMDTAEYLPWCRKIDESKQTIADLRDYIDELKAEHVDVQTQEEEPADDTVEEVAELPVTVIVDDKPSFDESDTEEETPADE